MLKYDETLNYFRCGETNQEFLYVNQIFDKIEERRKGCSEGQSFGGKEMCIR